MDEREELKIQWEQELQWVKYRQNMLDIMDEKLLQMKEIAEKSKLGNLTLGELEVLNAKLNNLGAQVKALDDESRKIENRNILE
ncbi:hypothetical protein [Clostridium vincentii]|uniref:Uncharacterized protein n=1 Tax=Clostridium vincentii TaxID=52704 RepID=A0A2T0BG27_9CLOT|nr:hypothetical protein [Clostridium vincentii]PRR82861.1 hypothetical protein CLVI_14980 [Clostridium vincentii]